MRVTEADIIESVGTNQSALRRYGEWFNLAWAYFGDACAYCQGMGRVESGNIYGNVYKILDHFIPESKGGTSDRWNLLPCCFHCNSTKQNKDAETWFRSRPFFTEDRWARIQAYIEMVRGLES